MHITRLTAADALLYRSLMLQAYAQAADAFTSTAQERAAAPEAFWVQRVAHPQGLEVAWGAVDGHALVGTVALECSAKPKTRHKGKIIGMYVVPHARGQGLARRLLETALAYAEATGCIRQLTLTVTEGNEAAIGLYASMGFHTFGVEPMAICTPQGYLSKVHMWRSLPQHG